MTDKESVLKDLAVVKAIFQQRTIVSIITERPIKKPALSQAQEGA